MNWKVAVFLMISIAVGLGSCENDFDLIAPGQKQVPVVYGVVNILDTAHYLRIEKIFVDQNISPLELAQDADNLYYDNLTAKIIKNGGTSYELTRVNGNDEGYPRDAGMFAESPNYLYKLKLTGGDRFQAGQELQLELSSSELDEPIIATTELLGPSMVTQPNTINNYGFSPDNAFNIRWQDTYLNAFAYDIEITVNYEEKIGNGDFEDKSFIWNVVDGHTPDVTPGSPSRKYEGDGFNFFQALAENIPAATASDQIRRFVDFDLEIKAVGEEFFEYILIGQVNTGITSAQIIPTYTNLSEGRGIFSSGVSTIAKGFTISAKTQEFLEELESVQSLNFQ